MTTMVWLPFSKVILPLRSLTAIPRRSLSGSVPITISAVTFSAKSKAIFKAAGSSGLGDLTVGKLPLGSACSATICTLEYPARFKVSGMVVMDVPCKEVKTMVRLSLSFFKVVFAIFTEASIKALSTFSPIYSIKLVFASNLISA